ncbi:hypothetical protein J2S74_000074 [Evansella vedderi]|uniref:Uncharacterized protein n=1 Tax=Evansella vedderi TaxID=38282 RepID=A0ABT9ZPR5_9BACI|nr:hypothetical protein [Evansella vedderi]MDQ0252702.1 hypothetical protein [Evansella vedderi]
MTKQSHSSNDEFKKSIEKAGNYAAKNTPHELRDIAVNQTERTTKK